MVAHSAGLVVVVFPAELLGCRSWLAENLQSFLSSQERDKLSPLVRKGRHLAWQIHRDRVLLELGDDQAP